MTIRPATQRDAPDIAAIWNDVIRDTAITFTDQPKSEQDIQSLIGTREIYVAVPQGRVVGFATFGPFRAGPGYVRVAEHTIYLAGAAQGQGYGRALMAQIERAAGAQGITTLIAAIGGEAAASQAFHARMGFEQVGHLPQVGWKFGRAHDLILMQKSLVKTSH